MHVEHQPDNISSSEPKSENPLFALGQNGRKVEWSGMQIAAIEQVATNPQPVLLPDFPQSDLIALNIVQVDNGQGATQLIWGDLEVATVTPARKLKTNRNVAQTKLKIKKVEVTDSVA